MNLSQSSKAVADPLSNVLSVLGARVTRHTRLEAAGRWALSFPALDRLKFVALVRGTGWITLPERAPQRMYAGDVCLIGYTAYVVGSDPAAEPLDGQAFYGVPGCDAVRLGGDSLVALGGTVSFAPGNVAFLLRMLPDFLFVPGSSAKSEAMGTILRLMNVEAERQSIGSDIVNARLADVLLVEAIRAYSESVRGAEIGWLGALSDPRLSRVLRVIHGDIAQPWTVAQLASVSGMSRAAFSAEFTRRLGQPPLSYVRAWRLTIARSALERGEETIATIASKVGYSSQSAFGHAFRNAFGAAPRAYGRP